MTASWGLYPSITTTPTYFSSESELKAQLAAAPHAIPRGLGRSYGDSSLGEAMLCTTRYNRFLAFDTQNGHLTCESGVSLAEMLDVIVPAGWFLPVTPGTKFVTLGGAIASDIHGKNHHIDGAFSNFVTQFNLMTANGQVLTCSRTENAELFWATLGGMGLTGVILQATLQLKKIETAYIRQRTLKVPNLAAMMDALETLAKVTYTVAWIDCLSRGDALGRGLIYAGEHATREELPPQLQATPLTLPAKSKINIPLFFPKFALNTLSVKAFNALYYGKVRAKDSTAIISYEPFFYPLDAVLNWNRIYGRTGFLQYQFVLPPETSKAGLTDILTRITEHGAASFLAVLKLFGPGTDQFLSFPKAGYTLALDFPIRDGIFEFLEVLDARVAHYGGRIYLTKDARMKRETLSLGYENLSTFATLRAQIDPTHHFESLQSQRLGL